MPWTVGGELPAAVDNLDSEDKEQWVAVANALLEEGYSEAEAIPIALEEVKPGEQGTEKATLVKAFHRFLNKHFGGTQKDSPSPQEIGKSVQEEQRMALFVVLEPDEYDLHNDIYSEEDVWKACNNFNLHCMKANLFHQVEIEDAQIAQSYITPVSFELEGVDGETKEVKKGSWLQWWYFPETEVGESLWKGVKNNTINGISIGGKALVEDVEEE